MSDQSDQQRLELALRVSDRAQVQEALSALSGMAEPARRTVLRPHWEDPAGVTGEREIAIRRGLDSAFNQLAALELGISTGYLAHEAATGAVEPRIRELLKSRAVARFVDDYSYFQVRLLANRLDHVEIKLPSVPELPILDSSPRLDATVGSFLEKTIELQKCHEVRLLFGFLTNADVPAADVDGYEVPELEKGCGHGRFRLWLADKDAEQSPKVQEYFQRLKRAVGRWVWDRYAIYRNQPEPVKARLAIFDIYWLLRLFNAEISTTGDVVYCGSSWLTLIADSPQVMDDTGEPEGQPSFTDATDATAKWYEAKRILRRALGLACDWIRGEAIEQDTEHGTTPLTWTEVFKAELLEILEHRRERHLAGPPDMDNGTQEPFVARHGLIGLAFSGGGIRSATFNLGILEALKENGLLRLVDYLSTVSGGGYIGGWLVANAKRRGYWVRREADWRESIKFLRDYSNYLSPHLGFMSADTWTMWTTFLRNTILVQLQVFLALAACLLAPYLLRTPFQNLLGGAGNGTLAVLQDPGLLAAVFLALCTVLVCGGMLFPSKPEPGQLGARPKRQQWAILFGVCFLIPASLCSTAALWRTAQSLLASGADSYGKILSQMVAAPYAPYALGMGYAGLLALALVSVRRDGKGIATAVLVPFGALAALVLVACALILVLQGWLPYAPMDQAGRERAFVLGPVLVIAVVSLSVYMLIGLLGTASDGQRREWWSRYGALLSMAGAGWLVLAAAAIYGPLWIEKLGTVKWAPVLAWLATSVGSVMAGKSGSTSGEGKLRASQLPVELLAVAGPFVAIAGIILGISTAIHAVLLALSPAQVAAGSDGAYWAGLQAVDPVSAWAAFAVVLLTGFLLTWRLDINIFGLSEFYRSRLVRCYLGASRTRRNPHPFTGFDEEDDLALARLRTHTPAGCREAEEAAAKERAEGRAPFAGPFPIVNCTLNLGGSSDLAVKTRRSDCFTMTPLHCGFNHKGPRGRRFGAAGGYCPTESYCGSEESLTLGQAIAVSGAAANPNMGYHTSPLTSFLMTVFNARLGGWFANPALKKPATRVSPTFAFHSLVNELFGTADDGSKFVDISDGGHFENLGIYELVRRRCRLIVAGDAECDSDLAFGSLGKAIRMCEVDFGAKIKIDVSSIRKDDRTGRSKSHCAVGRIEYANGAIGDLIYIKASLLENENTAVLEYQSDHPDFPHESTADQFFTENQFESYRKLGYDSTKRTFRDSTLKSVQDVELEEFAQELSDIWTPVKNSAPSFISSTNQLSRLWETLGKDPALQNLSNEIINHTPPPPGRPVSVSPREFYFCNEIIQLMENVHLDLHLDDTWDDPDNAGWKDLFLKCSRSGTFRIVWEKSCGTYGRRFHYFCKRKLNLM